MGMMGMPGMVAWECGYARYGWADARYDDGGMGGMGMGG